MTAGAIADAYRDAAARLFPYTYLSPHGSVQQPYSGGAFVEVFVFVPEAEIRRRGVDDRKNIGEDNGKP